MFCMLYTNSSHKYGFASDPSIEAIHSAISQIASTSSLKQYTFQLEQSLNFSIQRAAHAPFVISCTCMPLHTYSHPINQHNMKLVQ